MGRQSNNDLPKGRRSVSTSKSLIERPKSSCSVAMLRSPVSRLNRRALSFKILGAYVSGMVTLNIVMTPAKINWTQKIHLQPTVSPTKPPTMGPRTGPPYGAAAKSAIAKPRSSLSQISEMVPPASVSGADAKKPARKRQIRRVWIFFATAQGIINTELR